MSTVDLSRPRSVHLVGIGGAGMRAIGTVLLGMGHAVSGSDLRESAGLERLRASGAMIEVGHRADNLPVRLDAVALSTAIPDSNPEVVAARERGVPVLRRAEILRAITAVRETIAVAGTHGKTTTSSMLALILLEAGLQPSFIIGGDLNEIGGGAAWDDGRWLVVEADESDGSFLELHRAATLVTSVEPDHLEHYGGFEALQEAFVQFVTGSGGPRVVCGDDRLALALARDTGATTYGMAEHNDLRMVEVVAEASGTGFRLASGDEELAEIRLPVAGLHNARNAAGAAAMAIELGVDRSAIEAALGRFAGVARRFEFRGEARGVTFIDDYAHLPTEVAAAVEAARAGSWRRIVCAFQPHRFSRTEALWSSFGDAFEGVDQLVVTDIYAAGEAPRPGVSGKLIVDAVLDRHAWRPVTYLPHRDDLVRYLSSSLRPGDLCLTLGAGDLTTLPDEIRESWDG